MFSRLIRAEWSKLWSVRRWGIGLMSTALATVMVSLLVASGSGVDIDGPPVIVGPEGKPVSDDFHFVHQSLTGDGSVTANVTTQTALDTDGQPEDPHRWAKAGVMIKESVTPGTPYAAIMTTPHGVRLQSNFNTDIAGSDGPAPRWLRLDRKGSTIAGYESADGTDWRIVGSVTIDDLPGTVEAGLFVASPAEIVIERQAGSTSAGTVPTLGMATFAEVSLMSADGPMSGEWDDDDIGNGWSRGPASVDDGVITVTGSGDIGENPPPDDVVQISQIGVIVGSLAVIAVSALFVTSEYRRGMIRTTFTAMPRRGRVFAAKAVVIGVAAFGIGLIASLAAFFLSQPILRDNGFAPPRFPEPSLSDPAVLRALIGSAALLGVLAVITVSVGVIVRRSSAAIAIVTGLFFLPAFLSMALPPDPAEWLVRLTPASGLAIQRSLEPTRELVEPWAMIPPGVGFGVLCLYATAAMAGAAWSLRRDA